MKQTINVSLSGIAFCLEQEGHLKLKNYFASIEKEYSNKTEAAELINDIETRITELILNKQPNNLPVTEETIDQILAQMGFPLEEKESKNTQTTPPPFQQESRKIAHRLYRNPKGAMLGGVCSGLASYFNIDPVFVRLLFIALPILSLITMIISPLHIYFNINISVIIIYIALWIVIPKARTPRQILEMQGEDITKEGIESFLREEITEIETNIGRITRSEKSASVFSSIIYVFGFILKILLYIIGIGISIGICAGILGSIIAVSHFFLEGHNGFNEYIVGDTTVNIIAGILICILPLIMLLLLVVKSIFNTKISKNVYILLFGIWLFAMAYGTIIAVKSNRDIKKIEIRY